MFLSGASHVGPRGTRGLAVSIIRRILLAYGNFCLSIGHQLISLYNLSVCPRCPVRRLRKQVFVVLMTQVFFYLLFFIGLQYCLIFQRTPGLALTPWQVHWGAGTLEVISGGALLLVLWLDALSVFAYSRFGRGW